MKAKLFTHFKPFLLAASILMLAIGTGTAAWAVDVVVQGRVADKEDNSPLPGVSIIVKGTNTGTITDASGNYTLNAPEQCYFGI